MGAVTLQSALGNPTLQQLGRTAVDWCLLSTAGDAAVIIDFGLTARLSRQAVPNLASEVSKLTQEQITEYKGVFEMFDEEGNGDVKTQELERLMSLMGINPTKRELSQMAKDVDKEGKGIFNCDSFLGLMALYHERTKNQDAELRAAFKVFDKEAKGYIDWNTLKYVLMNAGEPLNEIEAEQMMKEADKDGDGTIDYEEFVAMMTGNLFKMS
ncbi:calglandulin-like [Scomber japonicus]|uniref:calglandulin-like n=1 Tax=Scomber japonicus TaxID=13676 RepID=UPI00230638A6|nr:calglandulin-like [Scomber japonicus]